MPIDQDLLAQLLAPGNTRNQRALVPGMVWITIFGAVGLLALCITQHPSREAVLLFLGAVALGPVWKLWLLARRDPIWLAFCLMMAQAVDGLFFLNEQTRPILSYGLTLILCVPALPALWHAWKDRNSAFRLYLVFCIWCLITVSYSIAPEFSIARLGRSLLFFGPIIVCSVAVRQANDIKPLMRALMLPMLGATMLSAAALLLPHNMVWTSGDRDVTALLQSGGTAVSEIDNALERFSGLYDNPNQLGGVAMALVGVILTYFGVASTKEKIILGAAAFIAACLTVIADSRSDMIAFTIGIALYVCWRYRFKGIAAVATLAMFAVLGITVMGNNAGSYIWRGDIWTLTGRTDAWRFALGKIAERPFTGYGWAVGGAIFSSKYFPIWWDVWAQGPRTSIHSGYLSLLVEVGIPATILWFFVILRPWVSLFRESEDRWCLKRAFFFFIVPMLIINFDESIVTDCTGAGFLFMMLWAAAEQYRLVMIGERVEARRQAIHRLPSAVAALLS